MVVEKGREEIGGAGFDASASCLVRCFERSASFDSRASRLLVLPVESCPEDIDRASVTVERRVSEELVVERQVTALSDGKIIIRFQRLLAGVAQVAVAVKNARAARLQEGLLLRTKHRPNYRANRRCRRDGAMRRL